MCVHAQWCLTLCDPKNCILISKLVKLCTIPVLLLTVNRLNRIWEVDVKLVTAWCMSSARACRVTCEQGLSDRSLGSLLVIGNPRASLSWHSHYALCLDQRPP